MSQDGATPSDTNESNDPCIRIYKDGPKTVGKHNWVWKNMEQVGQPLTKRCSTCGVERVLDLPRDRFSGQ